MGLSINDVIIFWGYPDLPPSSYHILATPPPPPLSSRHILASPPCHHAIFWLPSPPSPNVILSVFGYPYPHPHHVLLSWFANSVIVTVIGWMDGFNLFYDDFSKKHLKMLRSRIFSNMDSRSKRPPQSRGPPASWIVIEQCMKYRAESVERSFGNHCLSIQEYSTQQCSAEQLIEAQEQIIILFLTFWC